MIRLREYQSVDVSTDVLTEADAELLCDAYSAQIDLQFPSYKTKGHFVLRSAGWVGTIPLRPDLTIWLEPKVPIHDLFRMLDYAYKIKSFGFNEGLVQFDTLEDLYERLASILAKRVLDRSRRGFFRSYVGDEERLPYVRGSVDIAQSLRTPWDPKLHCAFEDHTADVDDNRILAWTLHTILRQRMCREETSMSVRRAWRALNNLVGHQQYVGDDCADRIYHRLNDDYRPLHALCRFFLDQVGPSHRRGERDLLPFLVNMNELYEMYAACYLEEQLLPEYRLLQQADYVVGASGALKIIIDIEIRDRATGKTVVVLDTKYKHGKPPEPSDLHQIVAYAVARKCKRGILIYPTMPTVQMSGPYGEGDIEVETAVVSPDGNIMGAVREYLKDSPPDR